MDTARLGKELIALCWSKENKVAEVDALLESLPEDQRREVVRYTDKASW